MITPAAQDALMRLTSQEIRDRRRRRRAEAVDSELKRLTWERTEIKAELKRVQEIHVRHLERILKKASVNHAEMKALAEKAAQLPDD